MSHDPHRLNPEPHYRLYLDRSNKPVVICVQDFDYPDYDEDRFLSADAWDVEEDANWALSQWFAYFRTLRDIADGHINLAVGIDRYDPHTGAPLPEPVIRAVCPDRIPAGGLWKYGRHWWEPMIERGHLAFTDTDRHGQTFYKVTEEGQRFLATEGESR